MIEATAILERLTDRQALALTAMGEARGDRREGMSSVEERLGCMMVVRNRLRTPRRFGDTFKAVCLQRRQFSCWNAGDPNRDVLLAMAYRLVTAQPTMDALLDETLFLADGVVDGVILDHTNGATHYYSPAAMKPRGSVPYWARGKEPCAVIGGSRYFRGV